MDAARRFLVILVISPSLLMTRTSSVDADVDDFIPVVLILVDPITESENNLGVKDPVLDRVMYLLFSIKGKIQIRMPLQEDIFSAMVIKESISVSPDLAERETLNARKYRNIKKFSIFQSQISQECYFPCS